LTLFLGAVVAVVAWAFAPMLRRRAAKLASLSDLGSLVGQGGLDLVGVTAVPGEPDGPEEPGARLGLRPSSIEGVPRFVSRAAGRLVVALDREQDAVADDTLAGVGPLGEVDEVIGILGVPTILGIVDPGPDEVAGGVVQLGDRGERSKGRLSGFRLVVVTEQPLYRLGPGGGVGVDQRDVLKELDRVERELGARDQHLGRRQFQGRVGTRQLHPERGRILEIDPVLDQFGQEPA